uniref:glutathione transferase n=1 Tax=Acrobeloides nanus TaxID=290746 RepID=A0A914E4Y4_9BILA
MVNYKLNYFDVRGLGEMTRLILHYSGQQFEDHRISQEEWPTYKSNLAGKDDWESAQLDSIADFQKDFANQIGPYFRVAAGFAQGDKDKLYNEVYLPAAEKHFPVLEKLLKESGSGFFGKSGLSWVDFYIAEAVTTHKGLVPEFLKKHPDILAHVDRVHNLPQLKDYIKTRKQSPF